MFKITRIRIVYILEFINSKNHVPISVVIKKSIIRLLVKMINICLDKNH